MTWVGAALPRKEDRRMLTGRAQDLRLELLEHEATDDRGSAHWRAHYTFAQTGRHVVNDIHAQFRFRDGKIAEHVDEFSFYRWSRQALGTPGLLLGWTPVVRGSVRRIRESPLLPDSFAATGFVYDVRTGRLRDVT